MSGKRMFRLWVAVGALCMAHSALQAAPPWGNLFNLNNVGADPKRSYDVTEENGPWMIMTTSFSGKGAETQAKELVLELRKRYKIPAYIYCGHFDPGEAQAKGFDKYGNPKKARYLKYKDEKDAQKARHPELVEVAVLAGDFRSASDKKAQAMLQTLKYAKPQCLEIKEGKETHQTLTGLRWAQKQIYEAIGSDKKNLGPMRHAFIIPNPMLPPDYFNQQTVDEETIALNKGVPHSLLECPGKYTVQVATFKGVGVIRESDIRDIEEGRKEMKSQLAAAAQKAHDLTIFLRAQKYEAYQYHDRYASIVTIGNFKSPGTTSPNGQLELDPQIQKIIDDFRAQAPDAELQRHVQSNLSALNSVGLASHTVPLVPRTFKVLDGEVIPCDIQPQLVRVPKRPISRAFSEPE
jgi:hypothetical protein